MVKFADDTYVIVLAQKSETCATELSHDNDWAERNNLRLNCAKIKEIVFQAKGKRGCTAQIPLPCDVIERVSSLTALSIVMLRSRRWLPSLLNAA